MYNVRGRHLWISCRFVRASECGLLKKKIFYPFIHLGCIIFFTKILNRNIYCVDGEIDKKSKHYYNPIIV